MSPAPSPASSPALSLALRAALPYAAAVFALGVVLGTLRVLVLAPRMGELAAVAAELPVMLAASVGIALAVLRRWPVAPRPGPRLAMGAASFALLLLAETALGLWAFGRTPAELLAGYAAPPGLLGLAGQLGFAAIPALLRRTA